MRLIIIFSSAAASHCLSKRAGRCAAILLQARWPRGVLLTLGLLVYLRPEEHVPLVTSSPNEPPKQPNLLLAMADQLRWDAVGYAWQSNRPNAVRTPNLDRLASESVSFAYAVSSTPTCTPARAALLTGRRPWGHGLLGYGEIATHYPMAFPRVLRDAGYLTVAIGKDHFGWNETSDSAISHGYEITEIYDGLGKYNPNASRGWDDEYDDYDRWFAKQTGGLDPMATLDDPKTGHDAWNGWRGKAYVYEERLHPTAWVGSRAVAFLRGRSGHVGVKAPDIAAAASISRPWFLKVSFHRPHSPYDPPSRLLDQVHAEDLPPVAMCGAAGGGTTAKAPKTPPGSSRYVGTAWCLRYRGNLSLGDPGGCGADSWANPAINQSGDDRDMWCGEGRDKAAVALGRRAYLASVAFVDEQVGLMMQALRETGLVASTLLLWVSDHGDGQGDHFHWRKGYPYEFSSHVPMLLRLPDRAPATLVHLKPRVPRGSAIGAPIVAELRDVAHTLLDASGAAHDAGLVPRFGSVTDGTAFDAADGKSLLCLLADPTGKAHCPYPPNPGPWRAYIDLEHSLMYNASNHWNALTDGKTKYVFIAHDASEQLFDLEKDPRETVDLAPDSARAAELSMWRARLVAQFEEEDRGEHWIVNGSLVSRRHGIVFARNFPTPPSPPPVPVSPPCSPPRAWSAPPAVPRPLEL